MLAAVPLTHDERAAVDDGQAALGKLLAQLADTPTSAGPTPGQLGHHAEGVPLLQVLPGPPHDLALPGTILMIRDAAVSMLTKLVMEPSGYEPFTVCCASTAKTWMPTFPPGRASTCLWHRLPSLRRPRTGLLN
jgi:hypothetical protein